MGNSNGDTMSLMEEFGQRKYEEGEQIGKQKGLKQGMSKASLEVAKNLLKKGLSFDLISEVTGMSIEKLESLNNELIK